MKRLALASLLAFLPLLAPAAAETAPPNIIVFLVDDMGVMDTSLPFLTDDAGEPVRYPLNDWYRTPNMERLAEQGIRLNHFYAMSVCSPTRVSILTGQNAARHHTTNWINPETDNAGPKGPPEWNWEGLKSSDVTLPGVLRDNGYHTIHVGKGHFGPTQAEGSDPAKLGFDVNIAGWSIGAPGSYYGEKNYDRDGKSKNRAVPGLEKYHGTDTFLSEALTIEARAEVAGTMVAGQPFFLYFAHYAVHGPFNSDPRFADHYKDSDKPENARAFATLIEGMDKSLGDMLDQLEELGIADNTLVFFLGDNGSDAPLGHEHEVACAAPLRGKKGAHYEGGVRVPFIAAWAKPNPANPYQQRLPIAAGAIQSRVGAVYELFPTILGLLDIDVPEDHDLDGSSLAELLAGKDDAGREDVFLMHYPHSPHRSEYFTLYRDGRWKVIYHYFPSEESEGGHYQLYDLAEDPFEQNNLADANPERLGRMMKGLVSQLEEQGAQYPVDENGEPVAVTMP